MPCSRSPGGACSRGVCSGGPAGGGGLLRGVPAPGGSAPGGACSGGRGLWRPSPQKQTATDADGTHPTGMHSCLF